MSGMDRLSDAELVDNIMALKGYQGDDFGDDLVSRLDVLSILSRRASQAAPAPKDNDAIWAAYYRDGLTLGDVADKFGLTVYDLSPWLYRPLMRMPDPAPAPSDGLREAVDAAWNDAIEAAAEFACQWHKDEQPDLRDDIRALRRAAPTEGAMRMETGMEHIARDIREGRFPERSEPQMRPAAPTEGEA